MSEELNVVDNSIYIVRSSSLASLRCCKYSSRVQLSRSVMIYPHSFTQVMSRPQMLSNDGSLTLPPASPSPATGRLYDHPANCCCIVCDSMGPSTYESVGASDVNSRSKFAVSRASVYSSISNFQDAKHAGLPTTLGRKLGSYFLCRSFLQSMFEKK